MWYTPRHQRLHTCAESHEARVLKRPQGTKALQYWEWTRTSWTHAECSTTPKWRASMVFIDIVKKMYFVRYNISVYSVTCTPASRVLEKNYPSGWNIPWVSSSGYFIPQGNCFSNIPCGRYINDKYTNRINNSIREQSKSNRWRNTDDTIKWFKAFENSHRFISFDIAEFYPSKPYSTTSSSLLLCYTVHHYHAPTKTSPLSNKPLSRSIKATILTDGTYRPYRKANNGPLCIVFAKIMSLLLWFDEHEISEQYVMSLWYFMFCVQ